ncbi:zinc-binding dehydrogenase [Ralstonia pseudosolanacearum]
MSTLESGMMSAWRVKNGALVFETVPIPSVPPGYALVEVKSSSLTLGEVLYLPYMQEGRIPGLEAAGVVVRAAEGVGPTIGSRVIAMTAFSGGGWSQYVALPAEQLGTLPNNVSWVDAGGLANAGLTALHAVRLGGALLGANVLVTGVTGTIGRYAAQLARLAGAQVSGTVRSPDRLEAVATLGLKEVVVSNTATGRYDLVIDTLGGAALTHAMERVSPGGVVASLIGGGQTFEQPSEPAIVPLNWESKAPGARLQTVNVAVEVTRGGRAGRDLTFLGELASVGRLAPPEIGREANWRETDKLVQGFRTTATKGKIVLLVD